jgi:hypothetical protein
MSVNISIASKELTLDDSRPKARTEQNLSKRGGFLREISGIVVRETTAKKEAEI